LAASPKNQNPHSTFNILTGICILIKLGGHFTWLWFDFWCFNATFSNVSAISWWPVLVVEEAGVPGKNHRSWASNW